MSDPVAPAPNYAATADRFLEIIEGLLLVLVAQAGILRFPLKLLVQRQMRLMRRSVAADLAEIAANTAAATPTPIMPAPDAPTPDVPSPDVPMLDAPATEPAEAAASAPSPLAARQRAARSGTPEPTSETLPEIAAEFDSETEAAAIAPAPAWISPPLSIPAMSAPASRPLWREGVRSIGSLRGSAVTALLSHA